MGDPLVLTFDVGTQSVKALLIDRAALLDARVKHDVAVAESLMMDAFQLDVRPLLALRISCATGRVISMRSCSLTLRTPSRATGSRRWRLL